MSDIARIANYSHASLYSYFTSKDDVLQALAGDLVEELLLAVHFRSDGESTTFGQFLASLRLFLRTYRYRAALLAVLDQATTVGTTFMALRREIRSRFASSLERALRRRAVHGRDLARLDTRITAIALGGMIEDFA
jgi:AcrR family transcriptional regulator